MNIKDFRELYKETFSEIKNKENYYTFLKTLAINYQQNIINVLSLYKHYPNAKKVETYNDWKKYGRQVKKGSKGIPLLIPDKSNFVVKYFFDYSQTTNVKKQFEYEDLYLTEKNVYHVLKEVVKENNLVANELEEIILELINEKNEFIELSSKIAVCVALNIEVLESDIERLEVENITLERINYINSVAGSVIEKIKKHINKEELHNVTRNKKLQLRSMLNDRGNSEDYVRGNVQSAISDADQHDLRKGEIELSNEFGERGTFLSDSGIIQSGEQSGVSELLVGLSKQSRELHTENGETNDGRMGNHRGVETKGSDEVDRSYEQLGFNIEGNDLERNYLSIKEAENASFLVSDDYFVVEFNEHITDSLVNKDYKNSILNKELLDEITQLDEKVFNCNQIDGEELGYYKFYIDHIIQDNVVEHIRIDIGDGIERNKDIYQYLYEAIGVNPNLISKDTLLEEETTKDLLDKEKLKELLDAYNKFQEKEYNSDPINEEEFFKLTVLPIAYTDEIGEHYNYSIQSEYDLVNQKEIITVESSDIKAVKVLDRSYDEMIEDLNFSSFDELISEHNTGIYSDDLDKLVEYAETGSFELYEQKANDLDFDIVLNEKYMFKGKKEFGAKNPKEQTLPLKNYKIENLHIGSLTPSERMNYNIDAITMLKRIERGEREVDINVQDVLSKYVGWGGLAEVFDESKEGHWKESRTYLKSILSDEEYNSAKASTLTSFYTPIEVIDGVYDILKKLGFRKGNILEPSCGVGSFIGRLPEELSRSNVYGVEIDHISGKIAKYLYPESNIQIKGIEETKFNNNFFDVVIGNVPFGDFKINDREYDKYNFLVHDYFFAKAIDKVRPGGIVAFITSNGTMDKKNDSVRRYIGSRCDLLGAIRLPNTTFKGVAGTVVTSDLIILKKKDRIIDIDQEWYKTDYYENALLNKYFLNNPDMVLGNLQTTTNQFGRDIITCNPKNIPLKELLASATNKIDGYIDVDVINLKEELVIPADPNIKNFTYTTIENEIYYRENSVMKKQELNAKNKAIILEYINMKDILRNVIELQKNDCSDEELSIEQNKLNEAYDHFYGKYGSVNSRTNKSLLKNDSNYPLISSIEKFDDGTYIGKGDIFHKRTITVSKPIEFVETSQEALLVSLSEKGKVDFDYMMKLTNFDYEKLLDELKGQIFLDIQEYGKMELFNDESSKFRYVSKDEYLSGNIKHKMGIASMYISAFSGALAKEPENKKYQKEIDNLTYQLEKLKEVMPEPLKASDINVRLGATWIDPKYVKEFMFQLLETPYFGRQTIDVSYSDYTSEWNVSKKSHDSGNDLAYYTYGTKRVSAYKLIEDCLNLRDTKVYDVIIDDDGNKQSILNKRETTLANQKQELIKEAFKNWIFEDINRREELVKVYNDKFNNSVNRVYDGSHLQFPGMNKEIELREHQKNAIARILYGGNTLLGHVVGAGKTYEMIVSIMERKRIGLCTKALMVVPNHIIDQTSKEFMELYPGANLLVSNKKDFEKSNRKRFISRIATGEYDAIIMGHSQFEKIPMSKEYQTEHIQHEINECTNFIKAFKYSQDQSFSVKQMEKTRKKLETRLKKLNDDFKKDDVITFEELGVDMLLIDEAHSYKNLFLYTKMRNVAGVGQSEALKSSDLYMKCRYLDKLTNNKGVVFATGTPISNSMTELYTMQRYLQYEVLKSKGLHHFDAWASTFWETVSAIELSPEGDKYRVKTRFSKFYNLPELMKMFHEVADIKTADVLNLPTPKANYQTIVTQPNENQKAYLKEIVKRAEDVRERRVEQYIDNMLKITGDGKKLALDIRLIDSMLEDDVDSKVNNCIDNIYRIYSETMEKSLTQLVFCDMSTPQKDQEFTIYQDIKDKLISKGVKTEEIAFIHDANNEKQKEELFSKVRKGKVRILIGSTPKMGAGTNVQDKLIAIHDLDVPWRPADLEQRAGRIVRRGNTNEEVYIYRYVTENTFDSYLWQTIENKQKFISQIMTSKTPVRVAEDVDESVLSYAEIKALATGNPLIKEKMELDNEVAKLKMLEANYKSNIYDLEDKIKNQYPYKIKMTQKKIEMYKLDLEKVNHNKLDENFYGIEINGVKYTDKKLAGSALMECMRTHQVFDKKIIGKYRNFDLELQYSTTSMSFIFNLKMNENHYGTFGKSAEGNITRMDNVIDSIDEKIKGMEQELIEIQQQIENAKKAIEKGFDKAEELKTKILRLAEINKIIEFENSRKSENDDDFEKNQDLEENYENVDDEYDDFENDDFELNI